MAEFVQERQEGLLGQLQLRCQQRPPGVVAYDDHLVRRTLSKLIPSTGSTYRWMVPDWSVSAKGGIHRTSQVFYQPRQGPAPRGKCWLGDCFAMDRRESTRLRLAGTVV